MGKQKKHAKKDKPFMKTHSKRTGKIILIALACLIVGGGSFFYLAWNEQENINNNENRFRLLSCDDMKQELNKVVESTGQPIKYYDWRVMAFNDKGC